MSLSPLTPYQFVVAGEASYVRKPSEYEIEIANDLTYRGTFSIEGRQAAFSKKSGEWCLTLGKTN